MIIPREQWSITASWDFSGKWKVKDSKNDSQLLTTTGEVVNASRYLSKDKGNNIGYHNSKQDVEKLLDRLYAADDTPFWFEVPNPTVSEHMQKIAFSFGWLWVDGTSSVALTNKKVLFFNPARCIGKFGYSDVAQEERDKNTKLSLDEAVVRLSKGTPKPRKEIKVGGTIVQWKDKDSVSIGYQTMTYAEMKALMTEWESRR